jgi:DNA-binding CsgD family transcriptional regulator
MERAGPGGAHVEAQRAARVRDEPAADEGVATPILALVVAHSAPEHADLLHRLAAEHPEIVFVHPVDHAADANDRLPEPLTERELEILAYLPDHATTGEIAERCYVSVNTLKTHTAHIYRKLEVSGRSAAIIRARELGLIERPGRNDLIA